MESKLEHLQLFSNIFNQVIDGLITFDKHGTIVHANPAFCKLLQMTKEQIVGMHLSSLIPEENIEEHLTYWEILKSNGRFFGEVRFKGNNQIKTFEMSTSSEVYNGLYMSILRDITEKREMEQKLIDSERKFRKIFDGSLEGMMLWKMNEQDEGEPINIIELNQAAKTLFSITNDTNYTHQLHKFKIHYNDEEYSLLQSIKELLNETEATTFEVIYPDGRKKIVEVDSKKNIITDTNLTLFRNVTEKLKMEEQLRKTEMLNVLGELAAGIAHEIRNPLTSLKGFIQLLHGEITGYSMYFNIIMAELERIESIVNEFLVLAKPQAVQYINANIVKIMKETIDLLHAQAIMDNIEIITELKKEHILFYCEPNQIKQVFINIVKNAIEVSGKGSKILISMTVDNDNIRVTITDQGEGIPEEKLKRLGEPFYTTKERGTGLGLMVSYKIIKQHGGKIEVESEIGKGSTFHILLPIKTPVNDDE